MSRQFSISGIIKYIHPAFVDCVLPAACGNYSSDFISGAVAWEVCVIHDDIGHGQVRKNQTTNATETIE